MKHPTISSGHFRILVLAGALLLDRGSAVMFDHPTIVSGRLYDVTDPLAEIRIAVSYSTEPSAASHYGWLPDDEFLCYVQACHDDSYPGDPESDFLFDPDHVIVRWDAFGPLTGGAPTGSTAWVTFSSNSAFVDPNPHQPSLAYFYHYSDRPGVTMTLVWSNTPRPGGDFQIPDGGATAGLLGLAVTCLGAVRRLMLSGSGRRESPPMADA